MTKAADDLFPNHQDEPRRVGPGQMHTTGILPSHGIATLIR
ncbi:MAG: 2'-deoxycytidine 5'-triphosphate deaminase, partial [Parvibaculum sp.]|nr:2'-deoxycytidine 5'-triphosphate deaminase [Parvibaculum sp.]